MGEESKVEYRLRSIDDCWWEDQDFHFVDEQGAEHVLTNAWLSDHKVECEGNVVRAEPCTLVYESVLQRADEVNANGDCFPAELLDKIEENCAYWANNCGGCETCNRVFGNVPPYDHQETGELIAHIRYLEGIVADKAEATARLEELQSSKAALEVANSTLSMKLEEAERVYKDWRDQATAFGERIEELEESDFAHLRQVWELEGKLETVKAEYQEVNGRLRVRLAKLTNALEHIAKGYTSPAMNYAREVLKEFW